MKQVRKRFIALALAQVALLFGVMGFLLLDHSFAWFSNNDKVSSGGMSVNAKTTTNLVIGKSEDELLDGGIRFAVSFTGTDGGDMIPATRDETVADTYLKHLSNHYAVDATTGNAKEGMALEFAPVPAESEEVYFVDYTVYIASTPEPIAVSSLTAAITMPTEVDVAHPYFHAASIDFYVGEVSPDGYRGTTSVSGSLKKPAEAVELFPSGGTVPRAADGGITVIMRCYFDGALQDPATGHAYINSSTVKTDGMAISVSFTATNAVSAQ